MENKTDIALLSYLAYNLMCLNFEQLVCDIKSVYLTSMRYGDSKGRPRKLKLSYKAKVQCNSVKVQDNNVYITDNNHG
jgi:hypothetical protein